MKEKICLNENGVEIAMISRGPYGVDHGIQWGLWADGKLLDSYNTLRSAKYYSEVSYGVRGKWIERRAHKLAGNGEPEVTP